jgi:hypothetical protein
MTMNCPKLRWCSERMLVSNKAVVCILSCVAVLSGAQRVAAQPPFPGPNAAPDPATVAWQEARQLEVEAKTEAAFLKYLTLPGGETPAIRIARPRATDFRKLLNDKGDAIPEARRRLVEADLLLALRDPAAALVSFQQVAQNIAKNADQGWDQGLLPRDEYFVEPAAESTPWHQAMPFTTGPGSHRDNWLIRRFIAIEAWDDARLEFVRMWQLHSEAAHP